MTAAIAFVIAAVAAFAIGLGSEPAARRHVAASPSAGVFGDEEAMSGDDLLTAIADQIASDTSADTRTGTYESIHAIIWATEIQGPIRAVDQQTWRLPDGTARYAIQASRTLPAEGFDPMTTDMDFTTGVERTIQDNTVDTDLVDSPDITLPTGGHPVTLLDWHLATQRHGQPATSNVRIAELVNLYHYQIVPAAMRAAVLRLLAQLPDVAFTHQRTTDPLHRPGIAFRTADAKGDTTLIIDPATGALNAVHETFHGRLFAYTLFYPSQWDDHRGPQTPQPTPISTVTPTQNHLAPSQLTEAGQHGERGVTLMRIGYSMWVVGKWNRTKAWPHGEFVGQAVYRDVERLHGKALATASTAEAALARRARTFTARGDARRGRISPRRPARGGQSGHEIPVWRDFRQRHPERSPGSIAAR